MNFQRPLAAAVMAGEKTVTRRIANDNPRSPWSKARCGLQVGKTYAVCPGRGKPAIGRVEIMSAELVPLGILSDDEARKEGFANEEAFCAAWSHINGCYLRDQLVWRVEFRLAEAVA